MNNLSPQLEKTVRCVALDAGTRPCAGDLLSAEPGLMCVRCQQVYPVIKGVALLNLDSKASGDSIWFEQMYKGRSRTEELKGNYLEKERRYLQEFVKSSSISGPSLEIGCGVGLFADLAQGFIGLEYSLQSLLVPGFELFSRVAGDATNLPFKDASMQLIFSFNTLEHIAAIDLVFKEMDRVCMPGGFLILKPAWHATKYHTELIDILPYHKLSLRKKLVKTMVPLMRTRLYKFATSVPWRIWRQLTSGKNSKLKWRKLVPYHGPLWEADTDAEVSLDCHEGILYFTSRGYDCLSHKGIVIQILAGHDIVVLQKPGSHHNSSMVGSV
jgi:SAM-dependent methyltransferase